MRNFAFRIVFATVFLLALVADLSGAATVTTDRLRDYVVRSADNVAVGKVDELLVDLERGRVSYLLVSDSKVPRQIYIPWRAVRMPAGSPTVQLAIDAARFRQAPAGGPGGPMDLHSIDRFFGVAPLWEDAPAASPRPPRNLRIIK